MPVIKLEDVSKLYGFGDATTLALDEVSLSIEQGEFVGVMGPSGCGKSTLMHIIGLLDRPTHGDYILGGRHVARLSLSAAARVRRDTIGFIFQSYNMIPRMTVLENVALPLVYKGWSRTKRLTAASNMLERVGMKNREYFYPSQLSGGQVQCAAIARALVTDPKLIIADEPTGNLDSAGSRLVMEVLSDVHRMGNTVLFVTHNPELTRYVDRVIYMRDGVIIHDEHTTVGDIAEGARESMHIFHKTVEDDLAGVSTMMHAVSQEPPATGVIYKQRKRVSKTSHRTKHSTRKGTKK
jgi:putative ABC transport system ATP-binding protein